VTCGSFKSSPLVVFHVAIHVLKALSNSMKTSGTKLRKQYWKRRPIFMFLEGVEWSPLEKRRKEVALTWMLGLRLISAKFQ